jgi:hypothetical protein
VVLSGWPLLPAGADRDFMELYQQAIGLDAEHDQRELG